MGRTLKNTIFLYSGYTPRSSVLIERVKKACGKEAAVALIEEPGQILEKRVKKAESIIILDLPNIKKSAIETIQSVKERSVDIKILAIHIYTTQLLIDPLLQAGVHGYMMYEPTIPELRKAIQRVCNGEIYLPSQIY